MASSNFIPLKTDEDRSSLRMTMFNPLRYMTEDQALNMLDSARHGRISRIQLLFDILENENSILHMCIQRRVSAVKNHDWTIKPRNLRRREVDKVLLDEQLRCLEDAFIEAEDKGGLLRAIEKLERAVFSGIGVVQPVFREDGSFYKFICLDNWNFAVDPKTDEDGDPILFWNPRGEDVIEFNRALQKIPKEEIIVSMSVPIDRFALMYTLARSLGMESYSALIGRKGLPATYVIAPEDLPGQDLAVWAHKALECAKGGSGAFPFGTEIIAQGIDSANGSSLQEYIEFCDKQIVLAATGGSLQSLVEATGLGSNVADAQADVFKSIVRGDCYKIGDLINRSVARRLLDTMFPGKPHLAYFDLLGEEKEPPEKYLQDAAIAKSAGLEIDVEQLQELTGYKLKKDVEEQPAVQPGYETWTVSNEDKQPVRREYEVANDSVIDEEENYPLEDEIAPVHQNDPEDAAQPSIDETTKETGSKLLKAFDSMLKPIQRLIAKLLHSTNDKEEQQTMKELEDELARLESADDTAFSKAMDSIYKEELEKESKDETEE